MKEKIYISEEDLFNYVFKNESIPVEKRKFIEDNYEKFSSEIEFCRKIIMNEEIKTEFEENEKLIKKLKNLLNIIILYPHKIEKQKKVSTLAAASITLENKIESTTLSDSKTDYMIRVITFNNYSEIFVFSTTLKPLNKYKLTVFPSEKELFGDEDTKSFKIDQTEKIEKIELEFLK